MFTANIDNLATAIGLFQNPNDLALRKSRLLHLTLREAIFTRNLYFSMARFYGKTTLERTPKKTRLAALAFLSMDNQQSLDNLCAKQNQTNEIRHILK